MDYTRVDVAHLMRRVGFGARPAEIDALMAQPDWAHVVDRVLDVSSNPADTIPPGIDVQGDGQYYAAWVTAVHYWMNRMATSPTPIVEKMALFWHGHFVSATDKVLPRLMFRQIATYRAAGLGDFHDLAQRMAIEPAMLQYLDNASNVAGDANENFARESMELFTMGNFSFAESDVIAVAKAWTGFGLASDYEHFQYHASQHDGSLKTLFGLPARNWDGPAVLTEIIRGSKQMVCARFIAAKLWSFLAAPNPPAPLVDALATAFVVSNMNITALLRAILLRPEFRDPTTRVALVRSPVEWVVAAMRSLGLPSETANPQWALGAMGQELYNPPNVAGWKANSYWISTSTVWARARWTAGWMRWKANDIGMFADTGAMTPAAATQRAFDQFDINEPSPTTRAVIEQFVAREQAANRRWAIGPRLTVLAMLSPDFQLN